MPAIVGFVLRDALRMCEDAKTWVAILSGVVLIPR